LRPRRVLTPSDPHEFITRASPAAFSRVRRVNQLAVRTASRQAGTGFGW
jgi:hypothetical protein